MNKMRELRKKKKLTMKELGKAVGVSESTISLYENGKHEPDLVTIKRIADILETSLDELFGREEQKEPPTGAVLDQNLVDMLVNLSPDQVQRVIDFVSGLQASNKV